MPVCFLIARLLRLGEFQTAAHYGIAPYIVMGLLTDMIESIRSNVIGAQVVAYLQKIIQPISPIGEVHRLQNPSKTDLEMIEVQSGSYLDEDDIVRLEDTYGRALQ